MENNDDRCEKCEGTKIKVDENTMKCEKCGNITNTAVEEEVVENKEEKED